MYTLTGDFKIGRTTVILRVNDTEIESVQKKFEETKDIIEKHLKNIEFETPCPVIEVSEGEFLLYDDCTSISPENIEIKYDELSEEIRLSVWKPELEPVLEQFFPPEFIEKIKTLTSHSQTNKVIYVNNDFKTYLSVDYDFSLSIRPDGKNKVIELTVNKKKDEDIQFDYWITNIIPEDKDTIHDLITFTKKLIKIIEDKEMKGKLDKFELHMKIRTGKKNTTFNTWGFIYGKNLGIQVLNSATYKLSEPSGFFHVLKTLNSFEPQSRTFKRIKRRYNKLYEKKELGYVF